MGKTVTIRELVQGKIYRALSEHDDRKYIFIWRSETLIKLKPLQDDISTDLDGCVTFNHYPHSGLRYFKEDNFKFGK